MAPKEVGDSRFALKSKLFSLKDEISVPLEEDEVAFADEDAEDIFEDCLDMEEDEDDEIIFTNEKSDEPVDSENEEQDEDEDLLALSLDTLPTKKAAKPLLDVDSKSAMKKHQKFVERQAKKGIVYLPNVPPLMRPKMLRKLLSNFGDIERIYMTPEDASITRRRKKFNRGSKLYTDAWVEFVDKRKAKKAALMLNGMQIGGSTRSRFHHDLWCIKYLSGFKWADISERSTHEKKVREAMMREEMTRAQKETVYYMDRVKQANQVERGEKKKQKNNLLSKRPLDDDEVQPTSSKRMRTFHQRSVIKGHESAI